MATIVVSDSEMLRKYRAEIDLLEIKEELTQNDMDRLEFIRGQLEYKIAMYGGRIGDVDG